MLNIKAATRLLSSQEVEAEYNTTKVVELKSIRIQLRTNGLQFSLVDPYLLYRKCANHELEPDVQLAVTILNKCGHKLRVEPGIFGRSTFALKGRDGIVLQKVPGAIRVFFSR